MKLAIQNSWPNKTMSAEREFIARLRLAAGRLGWSATEVVTSDDIIEAAPDLVLVTHEFSPKLTSYPTVGLIWSPTAFFAGDPDRVRSILSYDGYLVATESLRDYLRKLLASHGKSAPISTFDFPPSAPATSPPPEEEKSRSLFYAGIHWEGRRHAELFGALRGRIPMRVYGDPKRWHRLGAEFCGPLPFDGTAVVDAIRNCGIALSLHGPQHRAEGIPSMRLFEAAAAGAVIISDRLSFAVDAFGDALLYVDADADTATLARQIVDHVAWIVDNPVSAAALASRSHAIVTRHFCLERLLGHLPSFAEDVRRAMGLSSEVAEDAGETVEIIVRVGSRPLPAVARAIESIAAQSHRRIGLIVVSFQAVEGLSDLLDRYQERFVSIKRVEVADNGLRSTALWAGLQAVAAPFFANLDDDDTIHPNHIESLLATFRRGGAAAPLAYAGTIQVQEDDGHWFDQVNFRGDRGHMIKERRCLRFLEPFDQDRLLRLENFIQSNAWLARREALTSEVLRDPELAVAEDIFLYLVLAQQGAFLPSWQATAEWNWRSNSRDNSMFSDQLWGSGLDQLLQRLVQAGVPVEAGSAAKVSGRGRGPGELVQAAARLLAEPSRFVPRLRYAIALLRAGGGRSLLRLIRRLGQR